MARNFVQIPADPKHTRERLLLALVRLGIDDRHAGDIALLRIATARDAVAGRVRLAVVHLAGAVRRQTTRLRIVGRQVVLVLKQ